MSIFTDRLAWPNLKKVVLVEVTAGEHLRHWTPHSGSVWYASTVAGASRHVSDVRENGVPLVEQSSIAAVEANPGSWYCGLFDSGSVYTDTDEAGVLTDTGEEGVVTAEPSTWKIFVHPTGSVSPYTKTLQSVIRFCFSSVGRIFSGVYYDPRVLSLPSLSMKIEHQFGEPGVLGTGNIELANGDGFFDALSVLQWDAGTVTVKMGADNPLTYRVGDANIVDGFLSSDGADGLLSDGGLDGFDSTVNRTTSIFTHGECAYADFDTIGVFRVSGWDRRDRAFLLSLEDKRKDLKRKIPVEFYTRTTPFGTAATYPNMDEDSEGDPIPIAYGIIYDVKPVCIDVGLMKFKVAGHAIKDFLGCRVWNGNTETWTDVVFATTDEANGEFTLGAASWDREAKVAVDFSGKVDSNGDLMDNAADIIEDILTTYLGVAAAEIHTASFIESHIRLYLGTDSDGVPVNARRPSLYLSKTDDATKVIERINALVGSSLFPDASGVHRYVVFEPEPGNSCETFDHAQGDLFSFQEEVIAEEIISSVRAAYQYRTEQEYPQVVLYDRAQAQYLQGATSRVLLDETVPCDRISDATYWAQRSARLRGERQRIYRTQVSHRGWTLLPAQQIRIVYARHSVNQVFEVLEIKRSLSNTLRVELILGDLHGYGIEAGFLSIDAPVFPASLGGGSAEAWDPSWTDAQKAWARQNIGYISDDNGFANATDPDSFNTFIAV